MSGPDLYATLVLAASILAPALGPRTGWVGETVFIKKPQTTVGQVEADGTFTPTGTSRLSPWIILKCSKC